LIPFDAVRRDVGITELEAVSSGNANTVGFTTKSNPKLSAVVAIPESAWSLHHSESSRDLPTPFHPPLPLSD